MSLTYGFYNSQGGDRKYNAEQFCSLFEGIIEDGVFSSVGDKLAVTANSGMKLNVATGRAWFNKTWTNNSTVLNVTIPDADIVLDRIDSVCLVVRKSDTERINSIEVVKGSPSSEPVAPTLPDDETTFYHSLADVYVKSTTTEITQADITNNVGTSKCPYVTGPLETINADQLLAQWNSRFEQESTERNTEFMTWFNNLSYILDGDVAGHLQNEIDDINDNVETVTLSVASIRDIMGFDLTGTIATGETSITISDDRIISDLYKVSVFFKDKVLAASEVTVSDGSVTVSIDEQEADIDVLVWFRKVVS